MSEYMPANMVCVTSFYDEKGTQPASYVLEWQDGFEAFTAHFDDETHTVCAISLGQHPTVALAVEMISRWGELRETTRQ